MSSKSIARSGNAQQPDYVSRYDDTYEDEFESSELVEEYERVKQSQNGANAKDGERTQIQPAEVEPRAPHIVPSQQPPRSPRAGAMTSLGWDF